MEHSLRMALWVFCLFGFLQATPPCYGQGDLGFCFLQQNVKCVNVTFTYPINVQAKCSRDALQVFVQGLNNATTDCQDDQERIPDTLESLARKFPTTDSANCKLQTKESQFEDFVKDLESLVQLINASGDKRAS